MALLVNGLDAGLRLHVARSAKAKARKPAVWVSLSPSVDAFSGVLVGLWVWLVLPGSAGADLYETSRLRDHLGAATWAQEQRNWHKVRKSTSVYLHWFASSCEAVSIVVLSIPEGKNISWKFWRKKWEKNKKTWSRVIITAYCFSLKTGRLFMMKERQHQFPLQLLLQRCAQRCCWVQIKI